MNTTYAIYRQKYPSSTEGITEQWLFVWNQVNVPEMKELVEGNFRRQGRACQPIRLHRSR